tara:strand:- start:2138 stop:2473 length:336 start_codon:yes stop_codon:yes gene_type:complete
VSDAKQSISKPTQRKSKHKKLLSLTPVQRRAWISCELKLRGLSNQKLAVQEGVSPQAISASAMGNGSSHLRAVLADTLQVPIYELFPEHFDSDGNPLAVPRQPNRNQKRKT